LRPTARAMAGQPGEGRNSIIDSSNVIGKTGRRCKGACKRTVAVDTTGHLQTIANDCLTARGDWLR